MIDARLIDRAIDAFHEGGRRVYAQRSNRASQGGISCKRRLLWHRTKWEQQKLPDVKLQRIFALGNVWEPVVVSWLEGAGIKVLQRQRDLDWPKLQLSGHIDGVIELPGTTEQAVFEAKSCSPFVFERIRKAESAADIVRLGKDYLTGYLVQIGLYMLLLPMPYGVLLFVNKSTGETHSMLVSLEDVVVLELAEAHLKRLEAVNTAISTETDLPAEPDDNCPRCPFFAACGPQMSFGVLKVEDDEELAQAVNVFQTTAEAAKSHEKANDFIKARIKDPGEYLIGDWIVQATAMSKTYYNVPTDIKATFAEKRTEIRRKFLPALPPKEGAA